MWTALRAAKRKMKRIFFILIILTEASMCFSQESKAFIGEIVLESFINKTLENYYNPAPEIYWMLNCDDDKRRQLVFYSENNGYAKYQKYLDCKVIVFGKIINCETAHHKTEELILVNDICTINDEYTKKYWLKQILSIDDCKDINFIKVLFAKESGIKIDDKEIEVIENEYSGGVPVQIVQLPIYYRIKLSKSEYRQYKNKLKKNENWQINDNKINLKLITRFDLSCSITENEMIFGFGSMDIIHP